MSDAAELRAEIAELVPGTRVASIVSLGTGARARTYRADVISHGLSQSWIVKCFPNDTPHAAQEFASYARLRETVGITPALIAVDPIRRILIARFLDHSVDLFVALRRSSEPSTVMRSLGQLIAHLIVATRQPPRIIDDVAQRESTALASAWPKVASWAAEFGSPSSAELDGAIAAVVGRYANSQPASLTQGDPAPSNVAFTNDGQARLIDFEYGGQRHVLADLAQWWIRCPLPEPWFEVLVDEVRSALLAANVYSDADTFDDDLAYMATYAALYMFTWLPINLAKTTDPTWVGAWRVRQAVLSSCARGARAARSARGLEPLAAWLAELSSTLTRTWPDSGDGAPDWTALVGKDA